MFDFYLDIRFFYVWFFEVGIGFFGVGLKNTYVRAFLSFISGGVFILVLGFGFSYFLVGVL